MRHGFNRINNYAIHSYTRSCMLLFYLKCFNRKIMFVIVNRKFIIDHSKASINRPITLLLSKIIDNIIPCVKITYSLALSIY